MARWALQRLKISQTRQKGLLANEIYKINSGVCITKGKIVAPYKMTMGQNTVLSFAHFFRPKPKMTPLAVAPRNPRILMGDSPFQCLKIGWGKRWRVGEDLSPRVPTQRGCAGSHLNLLATKDFPQSGGMENIWERQGGPGSRFPRPPQGAPGSGTRTTGPLWGANPKSGMFGGQKAGKTPAQLECPLKRRSRTQRPSRP
ncbi:hypothetical protein GWK47_010138 [Chionoecetes opilio]|uniref:Uncharacterized protein n=1 Tax=Chionoecetes opilio TaxID=41210 RepID=A0A8J4XYC7_CHIOP|nr:hypothetical protein GWK47_010138 [Chionoecetes opilio]